MASNVQEAHYDAASDYLLGSPHLRHRRLNDRLLSFAMEAFDSVVANELPPHVLEIGGGDGSLTEPLLAAGFAVTSTEMSRASAQRMQRRFRHNDRFRAVYDSEGNLAPLAGERFGGVLFSSVLHHIPDYLEMIRMVIDAHLLVGGTLVTIQDPIWFDRMPPAVRRASSAAYLSWRVFQGDIQQGVRTRLRRAVFGLSETETSDTVEYHAVREGVDELAVARLLEESFDEVEVVRYWSSQGPPQQRIGEMLGIHNTFAVAARALRTGEPAAS